MEKVVLELVQLQCNLKIILELVNLYFHVVPRLFGLVLMLNVPVNNFNFSLRRF